MSHSQLVLESKALVRYNAEALLEETLRADESIMKLQKELGLKVWGDMGRYAEMWSPS